MSFELQGENTEGLGLYFKKGSLYKEFLQLPKPKERYSYDWKDQHGLERDTISPIAYEAMRYNIGCYIVANDLSDLLNMRTALLELLSNPEGFIFKSNTLGKSYKLHYIECQGFNTLNPIWSNGKLYCEFNLVLENDFEPTLNEFYLADDEALIITEDDEYIVVEDYEVNF